MTLGGWAFEKGKRGPNESKVTLFTIGTAFLASGLNVTINERNLMFEKKNIKKYESGGPFKRVKTCPNGPKVIFLLIKTYFLEYLCSERFPAARRCACFISIRVSPRHLIFADFHISDQTFLSKQKIYWK